MEKDRVGIITFHCSDNYGAMLQAYGLKTYLRGRGIRADIVRYEPPFMTGRHWWIPYAPLKGMFVYTMRGWRSNVRLGKRFFHRKRNMAVFRNSYLVDAEQKKMFFLPQLKNLAYSCYLVGSDQIWNPEITCGLRKAYFGAFKSRKEKKVIVYAASIGGESLPEKYRKDFAKLLDSVDAVSVREQAAVPYIQGLYQGEVTAVCDPVLLLEEKSWRHVERRPRKKGYILVYMTEENDTLISCVKQLSEEKKLPVIELRSSAGASDQDFIADYEAGPAEFLGYIHKADYVVTNSFHGTVFSIIFQKSFMAFGHSCFGARICNVLQILGLEERLYRPGSLPEIDAVIDWENVKRRTKEYVRLSETFLIKNLDK